MTKLLHSAALICVSIAVVTDVRHHRIPNWLTIPMMLLGLILNGLFYGLDGFFMSLKGLALGFALLFFVYLLGGMGGGDVKLLAAVGALLGPRMVFIAFIWTALVGGGMAIVVVISKKAFNRTFQNLRMLILSWVLGVSTEDANFTIRNPSLAKLPYGVAIALGTALAVWLQRIPRLDY